MATNNSWNSGIPVIVSSGGTGIASATAYSVLCSGTTSTGPLQNVSGVGTSGQVLTSNGASALPTWQAAAGGGVSGPGSTTNLAIATWNGTGGAALFDNSSAKIDSSGRCTNTSQPCFFAYASTSANQTGDGTLYTMPYATSWFDQNSNFNTGTYTFTAPVTGKYCFVISPTLRGGTTTSLQTLMNMYLHTTSTTFSTCWSNYINSASKSAGVVYTYGIPFKIITQMTAADTAYVELNIGAGTGVSTKDIGPYNAANNQAQCSFSGFLIC